MITVGEFPSHLDVEATNTCNLRCPFWATTHNHYKKGFEEEKVWKIILELRESEISKTTGKDVL